MTIAAAPTPASDRAFRSQGRSGFPSSVIAIAYRSAIGSR
jgi:hypothetical protein